MKIHYVSDLHFEIHGNHVVPSFITGTKDEILVVAGDTVSVNHLHPSKTDAEARGVRKRFRKFLEQVSGFSKIVFLLGNHEFYFWDFLTTRYLFECFLYEDCALDRDQFVLLECGELEINPDVILLGATLWTDFDKANPIAMQSCQQGMNDYRNISVGKDTKLKAGDTLALHRYTLDWLGQKADENSHRRVIVATHHAPSRLSLNKGYNRANTMHAYYSDLSDFILDRPQISDWIHGHTHIQDSYDIGTTKVHSLARGYKMYSQDVYFNKKTFDGSFIEV